MPSDEPPDAPDWKPLPGPQTDAYTSKADVLFYGGAAGGGKTDLLIGVAHTKHTRSIIFRREYAQLKAIIDRTDELFYGKGKFNKAAMIWALKDGRMIEFGAVQHPGDERKYQGRAHDLKGFDELSHFGEQQFRMLCGWLRSADVHQRCRVLATGNPPTDAEGEWIIRYFAPWLDPTHPNPAKSGELRWFTMLDGRDTELASGEPIQHHGEWVVPKSRTFIPAHVEDNPYYMESGYKATLQALPEPLRTKLLYGNFTVGREDNAYQIIPTEWIELAMQRGKDRERPATLSCIGVDVARGGSDRTVLTLRYDHWFERQLVYAGKDTPNGDSVAQRVISLRGASDCNIHVDVIGVGASAFDALKRILKKNVYAMHASNRSDAKDKNGNLAFFNKRAEWWWKLREALDPIEGAGLVLPEDRELLSDLAAPRYSLSERGIQAELKEAIAQRIGRSPDKGDSLVYAHAVSYLPGEGYILYYQNQTQGLE